MGTIETIKKMYFIMDYSGNYYQLDSDGQLVAADGKEDAVFFTYEEADMRIGNGKRAQFYRIVQAAESAGESCVEGESEAADGISNPEEEPASEELGMPSEAAGSETGKDQDSGDGMIAGKNMFMKRWCAEEFAELAEVDWLMYLQNFSYIVANIRPYRKQLIDELSKAERTLCDLLHYVEFYDLDECQAKGIMDEIKRAREYRRDIKNELFRVDQFHAAVGTQNNIRCAEKAIQMIKKTESKGYRPRVLQELFDEAPEEERRDITSFDRMAQRYEQMASEGGYENSGNDGRGYAEEGEFENMDMERRDTIYDGKQVDWDAFVKEQADFFRNARQHIINLRLDIEILEGEIEDLMLCCEEENCNVTQGYKLYRRLKELRIARKDKQSQLRKVSAVADRFDCDIMQEIFEEVEEELGIAPACGKMGQAGQENVEDVQRKTEMAAEESADLSESSLSKGEEAKRIQEAV